MILTETGSIPAIALPIQALSEHLRLGDGFADAGAEDALLERLLRQAIKSVEQRTGLALIRRGFVLEVGEWNRHGQLVLPIGPVEALQTVEILQNGALLRTVDAATWQVWPGSGRQKVTAAYDVDLPALGGGETARIAFEAGFGPAWDDVPEDLARAVMLLAAHGYDYPSGDGEMLGMPAGVLALIDLRRQVRL